jgi:hypothetical protein
MYYYPAASTGDSMTWKNVQFFLYGDNRHSNMIQFEKGWVISESIVGKPQIYHLCRRSLDYPAARRFRRFFIFPKKARCVICAKKVPENIVSQALLLGVKIRER